MMDLYIESTLSAASPWNDIDTSLHDTKSLPSTPSPFPNLNLSVQLHHYSSLLPRKSHTHPTSVQSQSHDSTEETTNWLAQWSTTSSATNSLSLLTILLTHETSLSSTLSAALTERSRLIDLLAPPTTPAKRCRSEEEGEVECSPSPKKPRIGRICPISPRSQLEFDKVHGKSLAKTPPGVLRAMKRQREAEQRRKEPVPNSDRDVTTAAVPPLTSTPNPITSTSNTSDPSSPTPLSPSRSQHQPSSHPQHQTHSQQPHTSNPFSDLSDLSYTSHLHSTLHMYLLTLHSLLTLSSTHIQTLSTPQLHHMTRKRLTQQLAHLHAAVVKRCAKTDNTALKLKHHLDVQLVQLTRLERVYRERNGICKDVELVRNRNRVAVAGASMSELKCKSKSKQSRKVLSHCVKLSFVLDAHFAGIENGMLGAYVARLQAVNAVVAVEYERERREREREEE